MQPKLIAVALVLLSTSQVTIVAQTANSGVVLAIVEPTTESLLIGDVAFKAELSPDGTPVNSIDVFLDGSPKPVCVIKQRPIQCTFTLPEQVVAHNIRAVANLSNGNRAVASVTTKGGVEFKDEAHGVLVPIVVTDYLGRFVKKLGMDSFTVLENGVVQPITFVDSERVPTDVVIAVDISGSMQPALGQLKAAVKRFLESFEALRRVNPNAKVTLLAFNERTFVIADPKAELPERVKAIDRLTAFGGTAIYDAVLKSMDLLGSEVSRKAVIVFTDGEDRSSLSSPEPVLRRIRESDATVYAITQGPEAGMAALRKTVSSFTEASGGRAFSVTKVDQLDEVLDFVMDDLANQYLLGYNPTNTARDGTMRKITVKTKVGSHRIRAREGYRATPVK